MTLPKGTTEKYFEMPSPLAQVLGNRHRQTLGQETKSEPVKNPGLLQHVPEVDVCIEKIRIQSDGLLEVVDGQPDLALRVEHAPEVAPGHGEVRPGLDGLQVASLEKPRRFGENKEVGKEGRERNHH